MRTSCYSPGLQTREFFAVNRKFMRAVGNAVAECVKF
jgi:hypothetical protein